MKFFWIIFVTWGTVTASSLLDGMPVSFMDVNNKSHTLTAEDIDTVLFIPQKIPLTLRVTAGTKSWTCINLTLPKVNNITCLNGNYSKLWDTYKIWDTSYKLDINTDDDTVKVKCGNNSENIASLTTDVTINIDQGSVGLYLIKAINPIEESDTWKLASIAVITLLIISFIANILLCYYFRASIKVKIPADKFQKFSLQFKRKTSVSTVRKESQPVNHGEQVDSPEIMQPHGPTHNIMPENYYLPMNHYIPMEDQDVYENIPKTNLEYYPTQLEPIEEAYVNIPTITKTPKHADSDYINPHAVKPSVVAVMTDERILTGKIYPEEAHRPISRQLSPQGDYLTFSPPGDDVTLATQGDYVTVSSVQGNEKDPYYFY